MFLKERYWRKNRRVNAGSTCRGVDLNRNFGFKWNTGGSSNDPCSDTYHGGNADTEPETRAVQNAILAKSGQWDAFVTIHSYGQYLSVFFFLYNIEFLNFNKNTRYNLTFSFTPSGWTTQLPPDYTEQKRVADLANADIRSAYNTAYSVGSSAVLLCKKFFSFEEIKTTLIYFLLILYRHSIWLQSRLGLWKCHN